MADFSRWQASLAEHRTAWIIACCCIATIFFASAWPGLFTFKSTSPASASKQAQSRVPAQPQVRIATPNRQVSRAIKKLPQQALNANKASASVVSKKNRKPAPEVQPKRVTEGSGNYYVQAGAFKESILARKLVSRMNEHGWHAVIVPKSDFHAVWVGPKNSRSGIENLQKSIYRTLNIKGFIVQKKPS